MADITVVQGDSSDTYKFKVTNNDVVVTSLAGYTCRYAVTNYVGDTDLDITGTITAEADSGVDVFPFKLTPAQTLTLAPDDYKITVEVINTGLNFNKETTLDLRVNTQNYA